MAKAISAFQTSTLRGYSCRQQYRACSKTTPQNFPALIRNNSRQAYHQPSPQGYSIEAYRGNDTRGRDKEPLALSLRLHSSLLNTVTGKAYPSQPRMQAFW